MGIETALLVSAVALAGVGAGVGVSSLAGGGKDKGGSSPQPLPQAPSVSDSANKAVDQVRKKRANQTQTVFTDPLGVSGEAEIVRKNLLGQ